MAGESVNEFCFLVFDLIGGNASLEREGNALGFIHPKFDHREEAFGLVV